MKLTSLNCPACNSPLNAKVNINQPFNCSACGSMIVSTDWTTAGQLICGACHAINGSANKYCDGCHAILQAGCPFCYTQNSIEAVNCKKCGVNLQRAWGRQKSWLIQREKFEEEHKTALKQLTENQKENLKRLLIQLDDPKNHPTAIPEISMMGADALQPLMELLSSKDTDARFGAAHALGNIGDERAIPALINALNDPKAAVRYWAIDALAKLKANQAVGALGEMLNDEDQNVGKYAKNALEAIGTADAKQVLRESSKPKWWPS